MTQQELFNIAEKEMERDGHLSKGVRLEIINAAKVGQNFELVLSTDDALRIATALRKEGHHNVVATKTVGHNRKLVTLNQSK